MSAPHLVSPLSLGSLAVGVVLATAATAQDFGTSTMVREHVGPAMRSNMGFCVESMGDLDGDGVPDYLTTAPYADDKYNGPFGRVYLYSGNDGALIREHAGTSYGGRMGIAAANCGDLDGDGVNDYAVGTPWQDRGEYKRPGMVQAFSGATGQMIWEVIGSGSYWLFGREIEGVGDVTGDGVPDVLVSAPEADIGHYYNARGMVYLLSGADGSRIRSKNGQVDFDYFGSRLLATGDLDGDSVPDFAVSSRSQTWLFGPSGKVTIYSGATADEIYSIHGQEFSNTINGFGSTLAMVGDWDQDGYEDIGVGTPFETLENNYHSAGTVRVFSSRSGELLHTLEGDHIYIYFGRAITKLEDFDGDGFSDIAVGTEEGFGDGGVRIYSSRDGRELWRRASQQDDSELGWAVADGGDLNGDGRSELLVSALMDGVWNAGNGALQVLSWNPHLIPGTTIASASAGGSFASQIDFPASEADKNYALLLSETGTGPSEFYHQFLPLTKDAMFYASVNGTYPSLFTAPTGTLDANGDADLVYQWSAGQLAASVGQTFWACVVSLEPGTAIRMVSAAAPLTVTP